MTSAAYFGIDVSKHFLDLGRPDRHLMRVPNVPEGIASIIQVCREAGAALVGVESTGGYQKAIVHALAEAEIPVAVLQPAQVRSYAKSLGQRAKNDAIDTQMIAAFVQDAHRRLRRYQPPPASYARLRALRERRQQVVQDRVREEARQEACSDPVVRGLIQDSIDRLRTMERSLDQALVQAIAESQELTQKTQMLQEEIGVGQQTALAILAHLPEIGQINRQQAAALAGLAPYDNTSGDRAKRRRIGGGRPALRKALYMAAVTAARHHPELKDFYARLRERGKKPKEALCACARKLLVRLNSKVAGRTRMQPSHT